MPATPRRRIVRRAVLALAGVVLLLSGYVGSYMGAKWSLGRGILDFGVEVRLEHTLFAPINLYANHDLPGGRRVRMLGVRAYWHGVGTPYRWSDLELEYL